MFFGKRQKVESPVLHATDDDFDTIIAETPGLTIVDFWAPWCGPCRMMGPILDEIAIEQAKRGVRVVKVNSDEARRDWPSLRHPLDPHADLLQGRGATFRDGGPSYPSRS